MPVAGDVEMVGRSVFGIVNDPDAAGVEMGEGGKAVRQLAELGVVIAEDKNQRNLDLIEEGLEGIFELRSDSGGGVEKVTGDDEVVRVMAVDEVLDPGKIAGGIAFGNGEAASAEGGGFPKVNIGEDQGF